MAYVDLAARRANGRERSSRHRLTQSPPHRAIRQAKDAARHRISYGRARVGDARLLGRIPPQSLDDGWWYGGTSGIPPHPTSGETPALRRTPMRNAPQKASQIPHPIEGEQPSDPQSNPEANPALEARNLLNGLAWSLSLRTAGIPPPGQAQPLQPLRDALHRAQEPLRADIASAGPMRRDATFQGLVSLLRSSRVFDLSSRLLRVAAAKVSLALGSDALHRVHAMLADVLSDDRVRSPGAVAAHRITQLEAGDLKGWPALSVHL